MTNVTEVNLNETSSVSEEPPANDVLPETAKVEEVVVALTKNGKPKKDKSKMYFTSDTQDAIVSYQSEPVKRQREILYVTRILPAFEKLVENLINIHKFTGLHDTYDDLKTDCITFLFETIHKFDANRGTNAFSYFNVVAKNWLIIKTKQKTQRTKRSVSLDDFDSLSPHENQIVEDFNTVQSPEVAFESSVIGTNVMSTLHEIRNKAKTENELICINSIITIFENVNDIDLLSKGAILLYMRELSGLTPKQLTTTMQMVKKQYRKLKLEAGFKI